MLFFCQNKNISLSALKIQKKPSKIFTFLHKSLTRVSHYECIVIVPQPLSVIDIDINIAFNCCLKFLNGSPIVL